MIGPTPSTSSSDSQMSLAELNQWRSNVHQSLFSFRKDNCKNVLTPRNAVAVSNDLTPGGALMKSSYQETLTDQYPPQIRHDLKQLYVSLAELLRHFWACFSPVPPVTQQLQEKANRMYETLKKFQSAKLKPFQHELARTYMTGCPITAHMDLMLDSAYRKYATWKKNAGRHAIG